MNIGIVGLGIVGGACKFGFEKNGHTVYPYDLNSDLGFHEKANWLSMVDNADVIYVCVPTPMSPDGSCGTHIVESVLRQLADAGYDGVVAIKSTIPPGTTRRLIAEYGGVGSLKPFEDILFVPEFLRERCAITDFVELNKLLIVGCETQKADYVQDIIDAHGDFPHNVMVVSTTQAELVKYYNNCFGAVRVSVANEFYELCKKLGEEYNPVKRGLLKAGDLPDQYFDVNENVRGWSSICWNKDLPAILALAADQEVHMPMIQSTISSNELYKSTPFKDTRESYEE